MVKLKIEDLAQVMGRTREEVEEMLKNQDVIELKLSERKTRYKDDNDEFRIYE